MLLFFFCCKQKAAYEVRISDWSSDVCSSDLNDHRLGANEAPPAIISIFLGDQLADVFEQIAKGAATSSKDKGTMMIGADTLPVLPTDPGRSQPYEPICLHRQPFRVPRARIAANSQRPDGHHQHDHGRGLGLHGHRRSEEHTSELLSLMRKQ